MAVLLMSITVSSGWAVTGGLALVFVLLFLLSGVVGPTPRYTISSQCDISANNSEMFLNVLESLTDAKINRAGTLEVLTNGPCFYPAALDAMRSAQQSICLEAYIFQRSEIGRLYLEVMMEQGVLQAATGRGWQGGAV
jgi:cardiolipin synthase